MIFNYLFPFFQVRKEIKMKKYINQFLKKFSKTKKTKDVGHGILFSDLEYAFDSGGVSFYKYTDNTKMSADRLLSAMDLYEELEQRINRDYLELLFKSLEELLNKGKLIDAGNLLKMAQSRLDHITNAQMVMKLATVVYIADFEDPRRYSLEDADKKMEIWTKNEDVEGFFLRQPISQYIPALDSLNMNIKDYLKAENLEVAKLLTNHLNLLYDANVSDDLLSSLKSQLAQEQQLAKWLK